VLSLPLCVLSGVAKAAGFSASPRFTRTMQTCECLTSTTVITRGTRRKRRKIVRNKFTHCSKTMKAKFSGSDLLMITTLRMMLMLMMFWEDHNDDVGDDDGIITYWHGSARVF